MQRRGEEEAEKRKKAKQREREGLQPVADDEEGLKEGEEIVYADEMGMSAQQRTQNRKFKKTDAYHLPELDGGIEGMRQANDPRVMSLEELEEYAQQFHNGEDVNLYDFSKIDFKGDFFNSLPPVDRYNILNAARLRSRMRMGIGKEQLEEMFPDRMEFSRFQIQRVAQRNELTQRLMNLNGMNEGDSLYGVGTQRIAGEKDREYVLVKNEGVEGGYALGVVSLDKSVGERNKPIDVDALDQQKHEAQEIESEDEFEDVPVEGLNRLPKLRQNIDYAEFDAQNPSEAVDSLFVDEAGSSADASNLFNEDEDMSRAIALSLQQEPADEELSETEHLNRAIALSLQNNHAHETDAEEDEEFEDVPMPEYKQVAVQVQRPLASSSRSKVANIINNRANAAVPKRKAVTADSDSDSDMDLQASLARARRKKAPEPRPSHPQPVRENKPNLFDGPLPFEKMDFRSSIFKSKSQAAPRDDPPNTEAAKDDEEEAGGFEKEAEEESRPLPPWLMGAGDIRSEVKEQQKRGQEIDAEDKERADREERAYQANYAPIQIDSSDEDDVEIVDAPSPTHQGSKMEDLVRDTTDNETSLPTRNVPFSKSVTPEKVARAASYVSAQVGDDDEPVEWSESDHETTVAKPKDVEPTADVTMSKSPSPVFEDVEMLDLQDSTSASAAPKNTGVQFEDAGTILSPQPAVTDLPLLSGNNGEDIVGIDNSDSFDEFSDPDDEELLAQLAMEAETHDEFAKTLNFKTPAESQAAYEKELKALRNQQKKDRRDADDVTSAMNQECQILLKKFGIPYIIAPGEAEAQCAELVRQGLVDGAITDDCDIFLFGGTRVYKNLFNSNKDVECYLQKDIEQELSLGRDQMISLAQLLGSDYAEGLHGVGSVTAIELLSEFSSPTGLQDFKHWWTSVQGPHPPPLSEETSTFRKKFRRAQASKLFLPAGFPSPAVAEAYYKPHVDSSKEEFRWGVPDLEGLRGFLMQTIGWSQERTDEVLVPVIRDMNRRELEGTQSNITRYFDGTVGAGAKTAAQEAREGGSKRMKEAVNRLRGKKKSGLTVEEMGTFADVGREWALKNPAGKDYGKVKKGKRRGKKGAVSEEGEGNEGDDDNAEGAADGDGEDEADDESGTLDEDEYRESESGKRKQKPKIPARQPKRKKAKT
ncbi:putative DNA repair protein rad13 [Glarea lozoyensis 74030]|nr:putative DNA repair protein rad13 [Glarea lozoyensis 74030]